MALVEKNALLAVQRAAHDQARVTTRKRINTARTPLEGETALAR